MFSNSRQKRRAIVNLFEAKFLINRLARAHHGAHIAIGFVMQIGQRGDIQTGFQIFDNFNLSAIGQNRQRLARFRTARIMINFQAHVTFSPLSARRASAPMASAILLNPSARNICANSLFMRVTNPGPS